MICLEISYAFFLCALGQLVFVNSNPAVPPDSNDPIFTIKYLIKLKRPAVHLPYRKFGLTYNKFSVCELRYNQKRSVCEGVFSSKMFKFQMVPQEKEYPDLSCHRRWVDLSEVAEVTDTGKLFLSMYECPNPYKIEKRYRDEVTEDLKFSIPVHFLLTGGYFGNSVVLSYKHVGRRPPPIKFLTVFLGVISPEKLHRLYLEKRNEIYEKQTQPKKFIKQMIGRAVGQEDPIQRYQHTADSKVVDNDAVKKKSTYLKFRSTYKIVNICAMNERKKLKLCQQVFESAPYQLRVSKSKAYAKFRCIRRKVVLLYTFVEIYSAKVATIRCPIRKEMTTNLFFLASMLEVPGMIAFLQIPPFVEKLPDAIIFGLNSEGLLQKPAPNASNKSIQVSPQKPTPITSSVRNLLQKPAPKTTGSILRKRQHPIIKR